MLTIHFCKECHSSLSRYGVLAIECYYDIVEDYLKTGRAVETDVFQIANFLENKGLILTTENGLETIVAKPLGISLPLESDEYFLCLEKDKHNFKKT